MKMRLFTYLFILLIVPPIASAQDTPGQERNVKKELKDAYKTWLVNDVSWLMTKDPREAFLELKTGTEREKFVEDRWQELRERDPADPFVNERYERTAYADANFTGATIGSRTARGWIYILWGKPVSVSKGRKMIKGREDDVAWIQWSYDWKTFDFVDPDKDGNFRLMTPDDQWKAPPVPADDLKPKLP